MGRKEEDEAEKKGHFWGLIAAFILPLGLVYAAPGFFDKYPLLGAVLAFGQIPLMIWLSDRAGSWLRKRAARRN
jgi:hypothetical protein